MTFEIDTTDIQHLENALHLLTDRAVPYAVKKTLDGIAWTARKEAQGLIKNDFVNRNKWTQGSIRVNPSTLGRVDDMQSSFGSTQEYMRTQEKGGLKRPLSGNKVSIPTTRAAGQGRGKRPRTRNVLTRNKMKAIGLRKPAYRSSNTKQEVMVRINQAIQDGSRRAYLEFSNGTKGIFAIVGGNLTNRGWAEGARLEMLHDMSRASVRIPRHRWMRPSADAARRDASVMREYRRALSFQIQREIKARYGV